jgi:hypothetical protein
MQLRYESEVGPIQFLVGSPSENGFLLDDSVRGLLDPETRRVMVFYAEEGDLASIAEELAHYFQYKAQKLLGKSEKQIGAHIIDRNERAMRRIMLAHGFKIRR